MTNSTPFWIGRNLTDGSQRKWTAWAKEHALTIVPPSKMHFTQIYAKDNDKAWPEPFSAYFATEVVGVGNLGDATVLFFNAPDLVKSRFEQLSADYKHSFPSLLPHVSLLYEKSSDEDLIRLHAMVRYMPMLEFGPESINAAKSPAELEKIKMPEDFSSDLAIISAALNTAMDIAPDAAPDIAKNADTLRSEFLTAFGKALANNPEVITSWRGKDSSAYKNAWRKILEAMSK